MRAGSRADICAVRSSPRAFVSRRFGLLPRFGLVSLGLIVALGVTVGVRLQSALEERTVEDAIRSAEIASRVGIAPQMEPDDLRQDFVPLSEERIDALNSSLRSAVSSNGIVRLKVWNQQHWIVYSDNERLIGRWFSSDDLLRRALDGEVVSSVTDLSRPEEMEEKQFGRLLAVYVPLRVDADGSFSDSGGEVVGAFEVYLPYAPIAAQIASGTRQLWITLAIGLVVLYLALFRLVFGASRLLRRQSTDNRRLARTDQLTGLANLVAFRERVQTMLPGRVAVMVLDLDRFQEINGTLGHDVGDEVLQELADRFRSTLGREVEVARLGGDEFAFAVVVSEDDSVTDRLAAITLAVSRPVTVEGIALDLSGSIGAALSPDHGEDIDVLLQRADVAMYHAKRTHANTTVYSPEIDANTPERLALAADFREALAKDQLFLVYQPKMDIATRRVSSVEALVRWRHPERGIVPPGDFLPVVEGTELIRPLTVAVLHKALDQVVRWRAAGRDIAVAVNLSARVCEDIAIVTSIGMALQARNLPASVLEVELTESAMVQNPAALAAVLHRLHDLGVKVAIDDFGTGYASISYLTSLPVDVLKIDREFVADVCTNNRHAAVVEFSTELARAFGMTVVAEGIEDPETLHRLGELGVHMAQGYFVARPAEALAFDEWLVRHELLQLALAGVPS